MRRSTEFLNSLAIGFLGSITWTTLPRLHRCAPDTETRHPPVSLSGAIVHAIDSAVGRRPRLVWVRRLVSFSRYECRSREQDRGCRLLGPIRLRFEGGRMLEGRPGLRRRHATPYRDGTTHIITEPPKVEMPGMTCLCISRHLRGLDSRRCTHAREPASTSSRIRRVD